jgi:hypothetical protein
MYRRFPYARISLFATALAPCSAGMRLAGLPLAACWSMVCEAMSRRDAGGPKENWRKREWPGRWQV